MNTQSRKPSPPAILRPHPDEGRQRRWTIAMGIVLAGLSLVACKLGERAKADGKCPPGETCSDRTPFGLMFAGPDTFNDADKGTLLPTAVGGRQTVTIYPYKDEPQLPYAAGFEARLVDSNAVTIESGDTSSLILRGVSQGEALLRLLEPRTDKLLDRVEVTTAPIAQVSFLPRELRNEKVTDMPKWAMLAKSPAELGVLLLDQDKQQIVDEGLSVSAHAAKVVRKGWDLYEVTAPSAGNVSFAVRAGGRVFPELVRVVASIDNIVLKSPSAPEGEPIVLRLGAEPARICFRAQSGGVTVAGARWTFKPSETVSIETPEEPSDMHLWEAKPWTPPSCVMLSGHEAGPAALEITAGNHSKQFQLAIQ